MTTRPLRKRKYSKERHAEQQAGTWKPTRIHMSWSKEQEDALIAGYRRFGRQWNKLIENYECLSGRNPESLRQLRNADDSRLKYKPDPAFAAFFPAKK